MAICLGTQLRNATNAVGLSSWGPYKVATRTRATGRYKWFLIKACFVSLLRRRSLQLLWEPTWIVLTIACGVDSHSLSFVLLIFYGIDFSGCCVYILLSLPLWYIVCLLPLERMRKDMRKEASQHTHSHVKIVCALFLFFFSAPLSRSIRFVARSFFISCLYFYYSPFFLFYYYYHHLPSTAGVRQYLGRRSPWPSVRDHWLHFDNNKEIIWFCFPCEWQRVYMQKSRRIAEARA